VEGILGRMFSAAWKSIRLDLEDVVTCVYGEWARVGVGHDAVEISSSLGTRA
jgi:hypothetical protein